MKGFAKNTMEGQEAVIIYENRSSLGVHEGILYIDHAKVCKLTWHAWFVFDIFIRSGWSPLSQTSADLINMFFVLDPIRYALEGHRGEAYGFILSKACISTPDELESIIRKYELRTG